MTPQPALVPTTCALCSGGSTSKQVYAARLDLAAFSGATFSARRLPDRMHYRIVRCPACGLVRSDPIASQELLGQLYAESAFTYIGELDPLRRTYGRYLRLLDRFGARKHSLLEVGCGNGYFLEEALDQGYQNVRGIEPSRDSIEHAAGRVKPYLICDVLRSGLIDDASVDVVCLFQVLDHVPEPRAFLEECHRVLRPGGLLLAINHNVVSLSARVLGERSPIFDVQHTFLYAPSTMAAMARQTGFEPLAIRRVWNTCSMAYLMWLLPLPARLKRAVLASVSRGPFGRVSVTLPLGNLALIGRALPAGVRSDS